jgi:hypothetical protein
LGLSPLKLTVEYTFNLVSTQPLILANLLKSSLLNLLVNIGFISLSLGTLPVHKREYFSGVGLTVRAIELAARHLEINVAVKQR